MTAGVTDKLTSQCEVELINLLARAMDEKGKAVHENARLREALLYARGLLRETYACDYGIIEEALSNKELDNG